MNVVSFFAGCGGLDLGFEQAGFDVVWANEFEPHCRATYIRNHPNTELVLEDICKISTLHKRYRHVHFTMRLARFQGTDKNEFIDNQRVEGNIFVLLNEAMNFFRKHLNMHGKIVGLVRDEYLEVPAEALREVVLNALCHRQYERYNLTIGIAIYDDRIEIENPGILPPQITPENILQPHISYPYNPLIANVLYSTTYIENWGSGVKRIMEACQKRGVAYGVPYLYQRLS